MQSLVASYGHHPLSSRETGRHDQAAMLAAIPLERLTVPPAKQGRQAERAAGPPNCKTSMASVVEQQLTNDFIDCLIPGYKGRRHSPC